MQYISVSAARKNLYQMIDDVAASHEPAFIKGKRTAAILISVDDWDDIQETLFVAGQRSLARSLLKGMKEDFDTCDTALDW